MNIRPCLYSIYCTRCAPWLLFIYCVGCRLNDDNNLMAYDILNLCAHILFTYVFCAPKELNLCQRCRFVRYFRAKSTFGRPRRSPLFFLLLIKLWMLEYDFGNIQMSCRYCMQAKWISLLESQVSNDADICWTWTI